jgi:hypothetical protein
MLPHLKDGQHFGDKQHLSYDGIRAYYMGEDCVVNFTVQE